MGKSVRVLAITALTASLALAQLPQAALSPAARFANATFLGTTGRIYFESDRSGNADIWSVKADGSELTRLTTDPGNDLAPTASPGGLGIAWISDRSGHREVWAMNYDGSRQRQITNFAGPDIYPVSWLPDGHLIFESDATGAPEIYIIDPYGEGLRKLTSDGTTKLRARASSTTAKIAYTKLTGSQSDLWVLDLTTNTETRVTNDVNIDDDPSWSPDGLSLVYDAMVGGTTEIFRVPADGSAPPAQLTSGAGTVNRHPASSPDGTSIVFESDRGGHPQLWTIPAAGGTATAVAPSGASDRDSDWGMQVLVVTTADDPGPAGCDAVTCSLRAAINTANARPGRDGIAFRIADGPQTIHLAAALPPITQPVIIDGSTQPGYVSGTPLFIFIDGKDVPAGAPGLQLAAGNSRIAFLAIGNFAGDGLLVPSGQSQILSNTIGIDNTGAAAPNAGVGVHITGGTTNAVRRNMISANGDGVVIEGAGTANTSVIENVLGRKVSATDFPGPTQAHGLVIAKSAHDNTIGTPGYGNIISGNGVGVLISTGNRNVLKDNRIGTDTPGTLDIGNAGPGVLIADAATDNVIGDQNVIAFNGGPGVQIGDAAIRNKITKNSIRQNGGLGIDLGGDGVTPNDPPAALDADTGPNQLQNTPAIVTATGNAGWVTLDTYLSSAANATYTIEYFGSWTCDASGYGEGARFIGAASGTTDATGNLNVMPSFHLVDSPGDMPGDAITATVTDANGNTSEFGYCQFVAAVPAGLHANPQAVNFGAVPVGGGSSTPMIFISNDSSSTVTFPGSWSFTGPNPDDFGATSACTGVLIPGMWCNVFPSFFPSAPGLRSALFALDTSLGPMELPMFGTGTGVVTGTAMYLETDGTTTTSTPLPGATITLSSGSVAIGSPITANPTTAAYTLPGLAPSSQYKVTYDGMIGTRAVTAQVTFTTDQYANATVPPPPAWLNRKNHTWLRPYELVPGAPATTDFIRRANESTWYVVKHVRPGQSVRVTLQHNPVDNTLLGYRDVRFVAHRMLQHASGATTPEQLQRFLASDVSAEDMDSEDMDSEDMDSEDMDSEDMDSEDMDSEDMDSDDMDSEDMDSDDMDSEDMDSEDMDSEDMDSEDMDSGTAQPKGDGILDKLEYKDVYGSAQKHALRTGSITRGLADESVLIRSKTYHGNLYFRVRGHQGAFDASNAFTIQASVTSDPACAQAPLIRRFTAPAPTVGKKTLILTNTARMDLPDLAAKTALLTLLGQLAARENGVVIDLGDDAALGLTYADWDAQQNRLCVAQANSVVESIRSIVRAVAATNPLEYVVIVGPDRAIPFGRRVDTAEISREARWDPYKQDSPLGASQSDGFFLTDDAYAVDDAISRLGHPLYVPARAVGRLVETADDITRYLNWYLGGTGTITVNNALVTGYGFVTDLAQRLADTIGAPTTIPNTQPAVVDTLINDTWSSDDLRMKLLGTTEPTGPLPPPAKHYDIIAPQGHYSANRMQPPDLGKRFVPADIERAKDFDARFASTLWMTIGCHSAHNVVDSEADIDAHPLAFAETLLAQGGTVIGGTGYQYGESTLLTNSEALYATLARELSITEDLSYQSYNGDVPIGKALANAKRLYLGRLLTVRGIDEKVVSVATLYGLPMVRVHTNTQSTRTHLGTVTIDPANAADLATQSVSLSYGLTQAPEAGPSWFYANGSRDNIVTPAFRPVLPGTFTGLTAVDQNGHALPGWLATGAIWSGGSYEYHAGFTPLISTPVTEGGDTTPAYSNDGFAPARPYLVNQLDPGRQTLVFAPMQFDETSSTARVWTSASFKIYYSSRGGSGALRDAPLIYAPTLTAGNGSVSVTLRVRHYAAANEAVDAFATYLVPTGATTGSLVSLPLTGGASVADGDGFVRTFTGSIATTDPLSLRVFFQVAGDNGKVSTATNNGLLFAIPATAPTVAAPKTATSLVLTVLPPAAGATTVAAAYRDTIQLVATLHDGAGDPIADRSIEFHLGGSRERATTDALGVAHVTLLALATPGQDEIVASFAETDTELPARASVGITVSPAPTQILVPATPIHVRYSQTTTLGTLALSDRGSGSAKLPLGDQEFGLTVIDSHGVASHLAAFGGPNGELVLDTNDFGGLRPGTYDVTIAYAGSTLYLGKTTTLAGGLVVDPENATVTLDPLAPMAMQAVIVSGKLAQQADGSAGSTALATVHVALRGSGGTIASSGDTTVSFDGTWKLTLAAPADLFTVEANATGYYTSPTATGLVPVYDASHFVNGGGTVPYGTQRAVIAFTLRYLPGTTTPDGNLRVQVAKTLDVRATSFTWLVQSGSVAQFQGTATVNGTAGYTFRVTATDGTPDHFEMRVWNGAGSYDAPSYTIAGDVTGNLTTH